MAVVLQTGRASQSFEFLRREIVSIIRELTVARRNIPVQSFTGVERLKAYWHKLSEQNKVKYVDDSEEPEFSEFATEEVEQKIPLITDGLTYTRYERKRIANDILTMDDRIRQLGEHIVDKEEAVLWGGDATTGITSFADTTNNTVAVTVHLDFTSFASCSVTLAKMKTQLRRSIKNKLLNAPIIFAATPDVIAGLESTFSSTSEHVNLLDFLNKQVDAVVETPHLGDNSGAAGGTVSAVMYAKNPSNMSVLSSELEIVDGETPLKTRIYQINLRSVITFKRQEASIYDNAVANL